MNLAIHTIDAAIVLIYMTGIVVLGIWIGRKQKNLSDYLLGGRDLPWWAVLGSIVATETSTVTFLSIPGIAFAQQGDLRFLQLAMGFLLGRCFIAVFLLPKFFEARWFTAYQWLEERFGTSTRRSASILFLATRNVGDGLRLFLTAIVLEKVLGIDLWTCILLIGSITIIYTFLGGIKSVVWNDCIQLVVYMLGAVVAGFIIVRMIPGGWNELIAFAQEGDKFRVFDFEFAPAKPFTLWSGLIGGAVLSMGTHGTDQMMVQRYLSCRGLVDARRALIASGIVVLLQFTLFLLVGVALACFYAKVSPDTVFDRNDEVFATFIVNRLPIGLVGLTLAAVFSAAMSTLSSSLNSSASAAVNDLWNGNSSDNSAEKGRLWLCRVATVAFGALQVIIAVIASYLSRSVINDALAVAGFAAGILLGLFALGILIRQVDSGGAIAGMATGAILMAFTKFATQIAWPWYALIGAVATFVGGWVFSRLLQSLRQSL